MRNILDNIICNKRAYVHNQIYLVYHMYVKIKVKFFTDIRPLCIVSFFKTIHQLLYNLVLLLFTNHKHKRYVKV